MNDQIPCPPPRTEASVATHLLPANACDSHAHLFGPVQRYPYQPERGYTPPDAPLERLLHLHSTLGISRGVLTQPSVLGTDNSAILDAVARFPQRLRAVVAFGSGTTDAEINRLHAAEARGLRLSLVDRGGMSDDGDMLSEVQSWIAGDESISQRVFVENPASLYQF